MPLFHPLPKKSRVYITRYSIRWDFENVREVNRDIVVDSTTVSLPLGYYNFDDLVKQLKKSGITLKKTQNNLSTIEATKAINLKKLGKLLGFVENKVISANVLTTSSQKLNLTNDLSHVLIFLNILNERENYHKSTKETTCHFSNVLLELPIDTTQNLRGVYSIYPVSSHYSIACKESSVSSLLFYVASGGDSRDYEISLSLLFVD